MAHPLAKKLYYALPGKGYIYRAIKPFYAPDLHTASYLKFRGAFRLDLGEGRSLRLFNDNAGIPTRLFWKGLKGHEPVSLKVWMQLARNARVIVDAGANFGLFGLIAKVIEPKAQVFLVEALSQHCVRIEKNLRLNAMEATVMNYALGNQQGTVKFYDMDQHDNTIGSLYRPFVEMHQHHRGIKEIEVPMTTLDRLMEAHKLPKLDLLKVDVEGAEFELLSGALRTIQHSRPDILCEISSAENAEAIDRLISGLGFRYNIHELDEQQGLIPIERIEKRGARNYLLTTKDMGTAPTHDGTPSPSGY